MRDVIFIALALGFFAACVAYIHLCDRVIGPDPIDDGTVHEPVVDDAVAHAPAGERVAS